MNNKSVRVIDEHGIDRTATVITGLNVNGSNYVIYLIERDTENDNLFVSLLLSNNDGTFQMLNIDDSMDKGNVSNVVKELVTFAVNDTNENLSQDSLTLADGRSVQIFDVLFNKEQNINVTKTYVTTVKKSISKLACEFYETHNDFEKESSISNLEGELSLPEIGEQVEDIEADNLDLAAEQVADSVSSNNDSHVIGESNNVVEPVLPVVEPITTTDDLTLSLDQLEVNKDTALNNVEEPVNDETLKTVDNSSKESAETPIAVTPILPVSVEEDNTVVNDNTPSDLVFDASKETNLRVALGDATSDSMFSNSQVDTIREFGEEPTTPVVEKPKVKTRKLGFAQSKFFLVVAILFFAASCLFLGYEVFRYFNNVG